MCEWWEEFEQLIKNGDFDGAGTLIGAIARKTNPNIDGGGDDENINTFCDAIGSAALNE